MKHGQYMGDFCDHCHLSGGNGRRGNLLYEEKQVNRRLLSWREEAGADRDRDERGGIGYEQLASDGPAGSRLSDRCGRRGVDSHRTGRGNLF